MKSVGRAIRKARIDTGDKLYEMAKALEVTPGYLSAVEIGRKPLTESFLMRVLDYLKDKGVCTDEIERLALPQIEEIPMPVADLNEVDRNTVLAFARKFPKWDAEKKRNFSKLLEDC